MGVKTLIFLLQIHSSSRVFITLSACSTDPISTSPSPVTAAVPPGVSVLVLVFPVLAVFTVSIELLSEPIPARLFSSVSSVIVVRLVSCISAEQIIITEELSSYVMEIQMCLHN